MKCCGFAKFLRIGLVYHTMITDDLGSGLKSHLLVEVASCLAPAIQNTAALKSCDLIFALNHT